MIDHDRSLSLSLLIYFPMPAFHPTRPSLTESESAIGKPWPCDSDIPWQGALKRLTPLLTARAHTYLGSNGPYPPAGGILLSFCCRTCRTSCSISTQLASFSRLLAPVTKAGASQFLRLPPFCGYKTPKWVISGHIFWQATCLRWKV